MRRLALLTFLLPLPALAHPGHEAAGDAGSGFLFGLLHPLGGMDHLLAMVAVGLWAATVGGRALWALPASFLLAMAGGGVAAASGAALPGIEPMILASVILLGAAVALALRVPLAGSAAIVALFGLAHGSAHGLEGPATGEFAYAVGFIVATAGLHAVGAAAGTWLARTGRSGAIRGLGGIASVAGVFLAVF